MARRIKDTRLLTVIHPLCCGLDVHKEKISACLITGRLLSVVRTCQLHDINPFEFLTKLVISSFSFKQHLPPLPDALLN